MALAARFSISRHRAFFLFAAAVVAAAQPRVITTFAGAEITFTGDGQAAVNVSLGAVSSVATDAAGNFYIADADNRMVLRVSPAGTLNRLAGNGISGFSGDGGLALAASLGSNLRITVSVQGNIYIADQDALRIRKISADGSISTVAGNGASGFSGDGGPATAAQLNYPADIAVDANENLYIADFFNHRVRKVDRSGVITTFAGTGLAGSSGDGGPATSAQLSNPVGLAVDASGVVYISEQGNAAVRIVDVQGNIKTLGKGFLFPKGISPDGAGGVYLAETGANRVVQLKSNGTVTVLASSLGAPEDVAVQNGFVYVADTRNYRVKRIRKRV
jgi:sugar lactone lactonase YvrE